MNRSRDNAKQDRPLYILFIGFWIGYVTFTPIMRLEIKATEIDTQNNTGR